MKYIIADIDVQVNDNRIQCFDKAMARVHKYILKKIDPTLPEDEFKRWYEDGAEKPFRWNNNRFYWSR